MSMRGTKRVSGVRAEEPGTSKRRRTEPEDPLWQLQTASDLKMSSIYNRSASEAPAELFRKDLISAMKVPDSEPLSSSEYWVITDTWKQEWERGVQVPVNPDSLPAPKVKVIDRVLPPDFQEFKLAKNKYIHLNRDAFYQPELHQLSTVAARAEAACSYDLDATDCAWVKLLNAERARAGSHPVTEDQLEKVIQELEVRCWDKIQAIIKSEEGLGIEYDENVICDVCRSPDSEDGNEMVFCDSCNICVHQACYGITVIPPGQWLCRPCGDGVRPTCVLCPNLGGAMKCTPSGHKWAHVSCVLWIPEVSIGCAEKMEPITKISAIPASRWSLVCVLCRERKGACIQCSVKTCKTAYHVTCAFKHGLEMRAIIEDENADDGVKLRSYCQKHSVNSKKEKGAGSGSEEEEVKRKRRKDMTSEEKNQARAARLQEIEREFDRHVSVKDISTHLLDVDQDAIYYIYNYWKLKRRSGHNRPLLPPKSDESDLLSHRQEQADLDKMKMFVQLRQDLERVRNLCYMVSRREKLSRSFFRMREQTFHKQVAVLAADHTISTGDVTAIIEANHGPSIYDKLYSHPDAPDHKNDFDDLLARIAGTDLSDDQMKDVNGLPKGTKTSNPYKKHYVNGSSRRSGSMYSGLSSEESANDTPRFNSKHRGRSIGSSTDEDSKKKILSPKKKISPKIKGKKSPKKTSRKRTPQSKALIESSSDEDTKTKQNQDKQQSKTLQQMEIEMAAGKVHSGTESDELITIRTTRNNKFPVDIYSDSSDNDHTVKLESIDRSPNTTNDSQQQLPRTKAAMKEFVPSQLVQKPKTEDKVKKRGRKPSQYKETKIVESKEDVKNKEEIKYSITKDNPDMLDIVPQRQAAKKASENMRSTTVVTNTATTPNLPTVKSKDEFSAEKIISEDDVIMSPTQKTKKYPQDKINPLKENKKRKSSSDFDRETISYVPQRQAAKKAAAHIKSGLGSKIPVVEVGDEKKQENEKPDTPKKTPKKNEDKNIMSPHKCTSSSSSNTSSSSYSSSSSSEDDDKPETKPMVKAREIKPVTKQPSLFSPPGTRPTVDLPFLDKVSRPLSSTSASSDSDSSKDSRVSGSGSPTPKRPKRRRKAKASISTDVSPRKAPDKKLKTSERRSVSRVPSPLAEGEEPSGPLDTRAATRARTRSTLAGRNLSNKCDAGQGKPSKDESAHAPETNKSTKEIDKPSKFPTPERETDETVNKNIKDNTDELKMDLKTNEKLARDKVKIDITNDSSMINDQKQISSSNQIIIKDDCIEEEQTRLLELKKRRLSHLESLNTTNINTKTSPSNSIRKELMYESVDKKQVPKSNEFYSETDKNWFSKSQSPSSQPPPMEKPEGHDKYLTEDKSFDSDSADKSSIKMIAKIQATLNENTMIKSPKTPLDARTLTDSMDAENPLSRSIRKRSTVDTDKKLLKQDASHVQGVEISKSAKIPSTASQFTNRSMFSPQSKESELFDIDMLAVDDGFNHDEMMKPFPSYPDSFFFKEDSKEQGVQETLNLVDRLRLQLSSKKVPVDNLIHEDSLCKSVNDEDLVKHHNEISPQNTESVIDVVGQSPKSEPFKPINHLSINSTPVDLTPKETKSSTPVCIDKWPDMPTPRVDTHSLKVSDDKYDHSLAYIDDSIKDSVITQSEMNSSSEMERDTVSKQSDDSQSISVVDHSIHSNDRESITQDNQTYDNNNSLINSDCATISSPYVNTESKWQESKITQRRSSASSTGSDTSICSQKTEIKSHMHNCDVRQSNVISDMPFPPLPQYPCPVEPSVPLNQYAPYASDASPFISSMGALPLFTQGMCPPSSMPLASPGAALFPQSLSFSNAQLLPSKSAFPTLCAAFTSSSQNIALTTAMIAPPTPKTSDSPRDDIDITGSDKFSIHLTTSSSADSCNDSSNRSATLKQSNENSNETLMSLPEAKPAVKSSKVASKIIGQSKSPGKSPRFSPRNLETSKTSSSKKHNSRNNKSQRGKGRSKSRSQMVPSNVEYMGNSIQSKLIGTVYDFNEEIANDGVDLKSLRERRKSIDVQDRKSDISYKESSLSPKAVSPQQNINKNIHQLTESINDKQSAPKTEIHIPKTSPDATKDSSESGKNFAPVVQPVLPGPVNMRTYQPIENAAPAAPTGGGYHNHLMAFASGTADQHLAEIDEEVEKQLHTALMGKKSSTPTRSILPEATGPPISTYTSQLPKVSLSDSRNQLKVKIKGPFLDANYSASSAQPVAPQPPPPALDSGPNIFTASNASGSTMVTGTTNLRRMRKKELLRQYWTQDMNMDDPTNTTSMGVPPPPALPPPLSRAVITIPKAVASMTSIPTREDYKGLSDSNVEKKKRKTTSGLSRELRHLEVSMNDDSDVADDVRLSTYGPNSAQAYIHKRKGRVSTKTNKSNSLITPKLKIKIGANFVQPLSSDDPSSFQFRPPKKRLACIQKPSIEDLRRESMKYRRMVMANFEEDEKVKKHKPNKTEKRKKKKDKKTDKLQVINSDSESATKLIIKIKRTKEEEIGERVGGVAASSAASSAGAKAAAAAPAAVAEPTVDPFEYDPSAPDPLAIDPPSYTEASSALRKIRTAKVTPIRLKLARSAEGSGYVMKGAGDESAAPAAAGSRPPTQALPLSVNKHCEVR